jgi:uncharacterized membrane protein YuzA (DUF378 family)
MNTSIWNKNSNINKEKYYMADTTNGLGYLYQFSLALVIVGALNWGLVGAFGFDAVRFFFNEYEWLIRTVYIIISLAAIYLVLPTLRKWTVD